MSLTNQFLHIDPNDLEFVMNLLQPIAFCWKDLGVQLELKPEELKSIEATPLLIPGGPTAFLQEMMQRYLNFAPPSHTYPTLGKLCDALRNPAVGEKRIAQDVEKHYQAHSAGALSVALSLCFQKQSYWEGSGRKQNSLRIFVVH